MNNDRSIFFFFFFGGGGVLPYNIGCIDTALLTQIILILNVRRSLFVKFSPPCGTLSWKRTPKATNVLEFQA